VFLIPQVFSHRAAKGEIPEDVAATGVNPAVFEISGHLLYKQQEDYDACTQDAAFKMLACASLTESDFYETCSFILAEGTEVPSKLPNADADAAPETSTVTVTTDTFDVAARKQKASDADASPGSPTSPPLLSDADSADGVVPE
jgi:GDP-L-galactose phosphorylase